MSRKHKKVLRKNITLIMCALIGTIVVVYGVGMILFRGYVKEIANIASRTFDFYGNELDQKMNGINTQLVNTLLNNKSIREIEEMDLNTEDNSVVYSIAEQNELKQYFQAMAINYGDEYHFWFYNIYSMAQLKHTEEIQQLALYVSGYMRSIFRKGTKPILMDEELQQIVNYVKIHNILYRYDCKCHICVDERVKQAMIPPLIMIVFVENCVKYTVGSKRKIEISIEGSFLDEEQKKIQIRIADNGPGFPENVLEKFRKNEFGANDDRFQIGIRNTKDRLQLLYGAEASLMLGNGENLGTEVIIIIPYQNGDEKSEYSISR